MNHETTIQEPAKTRAEALANDSSRAQALSRSTPDPKALVMAFYEAFDRGTLDRFDAIDGEFQAKVFGSTVLDWPGFFAFAQSFREGFPNGRHAFDFVITEGDNVATIGHYRGRHERAFMGVAATGNEVNFVVMHVDRVREGRIIEHRGIGDINAMWAQLKVAPPAAA